MRPLIAFAAVLVLSPPALAVDYTVLRWNKTGQCEIVTHLPLWGDHFVALGTYTSQYEAEMALAKNRKMRACPASKSAKRMEAPPEHRKFAPTARAGRVDNPMIQ